MAKPRRYTIDPDLLTQLLAKSASASRPIKDRLGLLQSAIRAILENPDPEEATSQ